MDVEGNQAAGSADNGRPPVKVGGVYKSTQPTYTDGQIAQFQADSRGNQSIAVRDADGTSGANVVGLNDSVSTSKNGLATGAFESRFNGASWDRSRTPTTFKVVAAVAASAGTGATVWTPTTGKKFRLMGYSLSTTANASLIFCDNAAANPIFRTPLLAASGSHGLGAADMGNGILSGTANNVLKVDASATTVITGTVWGTEE